MVTKAIIQEVLSPHKVKVRMPLFNKIENANGSTPNRELPVCPICTLPNFINDPRVGDIVFVAPEDYDVSRPVVLGYLSNPNTTYPLMDISCNNFNASGDITLSKEITVGDIKYENIKCLKNLTSNIKLEIERIDKALSDIDASITALNTTSSQNTNDISVLQNDVKGLSDAIGALSKRMTSAESTLSVLEDKYIQKSPTVVGKSSYGTTLPSSGQDGQIFFLLK